MKKRAMRSFEASEINEERLEFAQKKLKLNVSEVINECLEQHLRETLQHKTAKMREALSVPIP